MADWEEIHGKNNWKGLLDPLKTKLGQTLIFYGKKVQALYDSVENNRNSPTFGLLQCEEKELFSKAGLGMYTTDNILYASPDVMSQVDVVTGSGKVSKKPGPIGYVAVAPDNGRINIMIIYRGTVTPQEWIKDLNYGQTSAEEILGRRPENPCVHKGFLSIYLSFRAKLHQVIRKLVNQYQNQKTSITIAGHCLGAALGTLTAADIINNGLNRPTGSNKECMVTVFALASPKVGNWSFSSVLEKFSNLHLLHTKHVRDPMPYIPPTANYSKLPGVVLDIRATVSTSLDHVDALPITTFSTSLDHVDALPIIVSGSSLDIFKYHHLKTLLKAIEAQQEKKSHILGPNLVFEPLENGYWKLYDPVPQTPIASYN